MTSAERAGRDSQEGRPSKPSIRALNALNVLLADVRDGMGPFLGTFLRVKHHWDPGWVGIAMAASQIGTVLAQTPAGALIDRIRWKRQVVAIATAVVASSCVSIYLMPVLALVVVAQTAIGAAAAVFPPAVAALTLGMVGRAAMPRQTGRNEAFNHGGNVVAAALAGGAAYLLGYGALFFVVAGIAAASAVAVLLIREADIDHDVARGADDGGGKSREAVGIAELFKDRRIATFAASVVLFHFANAAMLPLVGQKSSDGLKEVDSANLTSQGDGHWSGPLPGERLAKAEHILEAVAVAKDGTDGSQRVVFMVDPTGRYTAVPDARPVVTSTAFC